jgi:zeaxanthin glucosyltransferase
MVNFAIICPDAAGHLNPMSALGHELQGRGHRIAVFARPDSQERALSEGFAFHAIGASEFPLGASAQILRRIGELGGLAGLRYNLQMVKLEVESRLRESPAAMQDAKIEALLVDQFSLGGGTIAERLNIPRIDICNGLPLNREIELPPTFTNGSYDSSRWPKIRNRIGYALADYLVKPSRQTISAYRKQHNLPLYAHPNDSFSRLAQLSQLPKELDFPRKALPSCFHYTGPYRKLSNSTSIHFPFEKLTGQPLIYASLGSFLGFRSDIFLAIAEACMSLEVQLVIALGDESHLKALPPLPGSPIVVAYAPQLELLQRTTMTITHAGTNTVLDCLSNGIPMVAIPITIDQPGLASRLAWAGAAEVVSPKRISVSRLREAIKRVLTDRSYRQNALRLKSAIDQAGGVSRAADIIEKAVLTLKPVIDMPLKQ